MFLVLIFTRGWVDPRAMVWLEWNMSLKNPVTPPEINPGTVWLVGQHLNHYATLGPYWWNKTEYNQTTYVTFLWYNFLAFHSRYCPRKTSEIWYHVGSKTDMNIFEEYAASGDIQWHSWLRHCITRRKVKGLIPDGVFGIFHWLNPSSCTTSLGSTQPVTEMSTRSISWEVKMAGA